MNTIRMTNQLSNFRIEAAKDKDVSSMIGIVSRSFSHFPPEQWLGNTADEEGRNSTAKRHLRAWREHVEDTGRSPPIQCIHTDSETGVETTVACAEWFIYPSSLPRNDGRGASYLLSGSWLPEEQRLRLQPAFNPLFDARAKWTAGRGYGLLMYMATDHAWRRQGASTMCVQWGIDQCRQLGVPAYLEATEEGAVVYQRLGFEIVDYVHQEVDGEAMDFPAMMWWPPGTAERDGRPAVS